MPIGLAIIAQMIENQQVNHAIRKSFFSHKDTVSLVRSTKQNND